MLIRTHIQLVAFVHRPRPYVLPCCWIPKPLQIQTSPNMLLLFVLSPAAHCIKVVSPPPLNPPLSHCYCSSRGFFFNKKKKSNSLVSTSNHHHLLQHLLPHHCSPSACSNTRWAGDRWREIITKQPPIAKTAGRKSSMGEERQAAN